MTNHLPKGSEVVDDVKKVERCSSTDASRRRCEGAEGHNGFCFHRLGRNRSLVQWGNAEPPAGQEEERWPVLTLQWCNATKHYFDMDPDDGFERDPKDYARYYPESHPAVLSPEEARLLVKARDRVISDEEFYVIGELCNRLEKYGKEHHAE